MSAQELSKPTQSPSTPEIAPAPRGGLSAWTAKIETSVLHRMLVVGALGILIMFGLFLANYSPQRADWYWSAMFPVFGLVCLIHQLTVGDTHGMPAWQVPLMQALHWLGPIVAVRIIFLQLSRGQMAADAVALMILLVLAVTVYLAGLHFDRSFIWVSLVLALAALGGTEVEAYFWLMIVIVLLMTALVVFAAVLIKRRNATVAVQT
jgi:hypothetical protein